MLSYQQFSSMIKDVLNHFLDVSYLESQNYFTHFVTEDEARLPNRIEILRARIREGIKSLEPPLGTPPDAVEWRCANILTMRYINNKDMHRVAQDLGLSKRQTYREFKKGLEGLIAVLWKQQILHNGVFGQIEEVSAAPDNINIIQDELKNWEINYINCNLYQVIEEACQLFENYSELKMHNWMQLDNVDQNLNVWIDLTLTKHGLYKILTAVMTDVNRESKVWMKTRKINEYFNELFITINSPLPQDLSNWQIAQKFFSVQGINCSSVIGSDDRTHISITFSADHQNKALVIDDVASVHNLIQRMLSPFGIQVFGTANPHEAIKLAQLLRPNFIIVDLLMPEIDGWGMVKMIKMDSETQNIPIFICSVLNEPKLAQSFGVAGFILKPIDRQNLVDTLQKASLLNIK